MAKGSSVDGGGGVRLTQGERNAEVLREQIEMEWRNYEDNIGYWGDHDIGWDSLMSMRGMLERLQRTGQASRDDARMLSDINWRLGIAS